MEKKSGTLGRRAKALGPEGGKVVVGAPGDPRLRSRENSEASKAGLPRGNFPGNGRVPRQPRVVSGDLKRSQ